MAVVVDRSGPRPTYEAVDASGALWTVSALGGGVARKHRAWEWHRGGEDEAARLLPRIVELVTP